MKNTLTKHDYFSLKCDWEWLLHFRLIPHSFSEMEHSLRRLHVSVSPLGVCIWSKIATRPMFLPAHNHELPLRCLPSHAQPNVHSEEGATAVKYRSEGGHESSHHHCNHQASHTCKEKEGMYITQPLLTLFSKGVPKWLYTHYGKVHIHWINSLFAYLFQNENMKTRKQFRKIKYWLLLNSFYLFHHTRSRNRIFMNLIMKICWLQNISLWTFESWPAKVQAILLDFTAPGMCCWYFQLPCHLPLQSLSCYF